VTLTVNGAPHRHDGEGTLASLLGELGANPRRVAIMVNDEILHGADRDRRVLKEGDRVEVLMFAGGG
jgi:sulfur carrier protein